MADGFVTLKPRYVNMADIMADMNFSNTSRDPDSRATERRSPAPTDLRWEIIELLFFAYRDFVGDADLLDVLRITKQSLGRVLKQLLDEGYIVQKTGNNDRRQRLLFATSKGEALVAKLAGLQTDRITRALRDIGPQGADAVRQFLRTMIDHDDPDKVLEKILSTSSATAKEKT